MAAPPDPRTRTSRPPRIHRPLLVWVPALAMGIAVAGFVPLTIAGTFGILGLAGAVWYGRKNCQRTAVFLAAGLAIAAGMVLARPGLNPNPSDHEIAAHADGRYHRIRGTVLDLPRVTRLKTTLTLGHLSVYAANQWTPVTGNLRLSLDGAAPTLRPGSGLTVRARIRRIHGSRNPDGFDYARYMSRQGLFAGAWARIPAVAPAAPAPLSWDIRIHQVRHVIGQWIDATVAAPAATVLRALLVGDSSRIAPAHRDVFARLGITHVLAISGLHIGLVTAAAFGVARWLLAWVPALRRRGWVAKAAAMAAIIPAIAYGLLAGATPATMRAMVMAGVFLTALVINRQSDPLNTLAIAALTILVVHPASLWAISFQLSFSAVAAIIVGFQCLTPWWRRTAAGPPSVGGTVLRWIGAAAATSVFATLGTLPLVLFYFHRASVVGLAANLLLAPVLTFVIIPLGLFGLALWPMAEPLARWPLMAAGTMVDRLLGATPYVTAMDWLAPYTVAPSLLEISWYYGALACLAAWALGRHPQRTEYGSPMIPARRRWIGWMAVSLVLVGLVDTGYWAYQRYGRTGVRVTAIDVGAGSATLMELPGGMTVLVDGGGTASNARFDVGERIVAPILWHRKIRTVDLVILSHPNADHVNGLTFICRWFRVGQVWTNGDTARTLAYRQFAQTVTDRHIPLMAVNDMQPPVIRKDARLRIVHPLAGQLTNKGRHHNDNSLSTVVLLQYRDVGILVPGDIESEAEAALVKRHGPDLAATVVMAPHHGSRTSSSPAFIAAARAAHVIVSARTGQAAPDVLARYAAHGARLWKTWTDGAITLTTDGKTLTVTGMGPWRDPLGAIETTAASH